MRADLWLFDYSGVAEAPTAN